MSYVIAVRLPSGELVMIQKDAEEATIAEFDTKAAARRATDDNLLCAAYGYDIVEIDA